jgi:hypothetical protein
MYSRAQKIISDDMLLLATTNVDANNNILAATQSRCLCIIINVDIDNRESTLTLGWMLMHLFKNKK